VVERERLERSPNAAPPGHAKMIRVLLADDHHLVRGGLRALLEAVAGVQVVAEAADGRTALTMAIETGPHVAVMDLSMAGLNGIEATRQIVATRPETKVLCLSMHADEQFVHAALEAGASGYLLKDCSPAEFLRAVHVVAAGQTYLSPAISGTVVRGFTTRRTESVQPRLALLTGREREVLQLIAEGHETKSIANVLGVSIKTVASHRDRIQQKLNRKGIADLTRYAVSCGLVTVTRELPS
jgi:DNA-binding NarL/FixJ family response regulator